MRERVSSKALEVQDDRAFRDLRRGLASIACILRDPVACCTDALISPRFVLADRDGEPTASSADKRIAHETLDWHYDLFHFRRPLLKNIEKLLRAIAGIVSHDCVHGHSSHIRRYSQGECRDDLKGSKVAAFDCMFRLTCGGSPPFPRCDHVRPARVAGPVKSGGLERHQEYSLG